MWCANSIEVLHSKSYWTQIFINGGLESAFIDSVRTADPSWCWLDYGKNILTFTWFWKIARTRLPMLTTVFGAFDHFTIWQETLHLATEIMTRMTKYIWLPPRDVHLIWYIFVFLQLTSQDIQNFFKSKFTSIFTIVCFEGHGNNFSVRESKIGLLLTLPTLKVVHI